MTSRTRPITRPAFTLVELIVALMVGVILAGATTASLSQFSRAKARAAARQEASARAHAAAARIAEDTLQAARDHDLLFACVRIADTHGTDYDQDSLLLWTRTLRPVRGLANIAEGADAEVQYKIKPDTTPAQRPALWRRADAPPDKNELAGGVAQLVVPGIVGLILEASDGVNWFDVWDSDADGYPHAVRITVIAIADDGRTTAFARRLVALDRTPIPPPTPAETDSTTATPSTTGGA